jgi:hypothetical protein
MADPNLKKDIASFLNGLGGLKTTAEAAKDRGEDEDDYREDPTQASMAIDHLDEAIEDARKLLARMKDLKETG